MFGGFEYEAQAGTRAREGRMVQTLAEALEGAAAVTDRGFTCLDGDLQPTLRTFADLAADAKRWSAAFQAMGLRKGDRVGLVVPDALNFLPTFFGAVVAGVVPVPMYPPLTLGKLDTYIEGAARVLRSARARVLITSQRLFSILWSIAARVPALENVITTEDLAGKSLQDAPTAVSVPIAPDDVCFLQFTSGSTGAPKGVVVTHGCLAANATAILRHGLVVDSSTDVGVTWLPLYHDMGLIGFVVAALFGHVPVVFLPTLAFVKRPLVWLETIHRYRGTITFGPNFAFSLVTKHARRFGVTALDLSSLRLAGCGAEPINALVMRQFLETFAPYGLRPDVLVPAYGMAEATLAISFAGHAEPLRTVTLDREVYEATGRAHMLAPAAANTLGAPQGQMELVSCGCTFPGHELRIVRPNGEPAIDGEVGEIVFRGPSVTPGYADDPDATRSLLKGGWLHTGDLGFRLDGGLYVSGRKKDLVILQGRKHHPQDIEWVVEGVESVRKGSVVAFAVSGQASERLVVVCEIVTADRSALGEKVKARVREALGIVVSEVVVVPAGTVSKTSSGKVQRRQVKMAYESGELTEHDRAARRARSPRATLLRHAIRGAYARCIRAVGRVMPLSWRRSAEDSPPYKEHEGVEH